MKLHADRSLRACVHAGALDWVRSPAPGVHRRMLERDGEEVARSTTIVRYRPGSRFAEHTHGGGEELLVLEGVFSDERGDYPVGTYVRNPIDSSHSPRSDEGCVIFVKLRQMTDPEEERRVVETESATWLPTDTGASRLELYRDDHEHVFMERWPPGFQAAHTYPRGVEIFVLEGQFRDSLDAYVEWSWLRMPADSEHTVFTSQGALVYIKKNHLSG